MLFVSINAQSIPGHCGQYYILAVIRTPETGFPGQAPYSYTREYSKTGDFTDAVYVSSSSNINFNVCNIQSPGFVFVRVTVESSDHEVMQLSGKINCKNCPGQQAHAEERHRIKNNAYAVINGVGLDLDDLEEEILDFAIYSIDRRLVSKNRNMENLHTGIYFIQLINRSDIVKIYKIFCYEN